MWNYKKIYWQKWINNGINNSSGDYIIFVDPDDYISTDLCENMRIYLNDNRNVDIVLFKYTKNKNLLGTIRNYYLQ